MMTKEPFLVSSTIHTAPHNFNVEESSANPLKDNLNIRSA